MMISTKLFLVMLSGVSLANIRLHRFNIPGLIKNLSLNPKSDVHRFSLLAAKMIPLTHITKGVL